MPYPKHVKRSTIIKTVVTILSFIIIMIFAPRMDGYRILNGIKFTTKTGVSGLTNLGWVLLVIVPVATYLITSLLLKIIGQKKDN